ncbi:MAG: hypothetical protein R1F54_11405 [Candidatus Zeuxoniibacter abyssi]|nr:MAG: hypothetical protein R1F54_11405 [Candidatus Persebacteraceae bacterium AB1(2)]
MFLIELERGDEVLKYYDRFVAPRLEEDSLLDLVDASSLLWRLELAEVKVGSHRWEHLADQWMKHVDEHVLVFNDLHLAMAAVRAGGNRVSRLIDSMDAFADSGHGDNRQITAEVGRALVDAVIAFGDGDYVRTTELLLPGTIQGHSYRWQPRPTRCCHPNPDGGCQAFGSRRTLPPSHHRARCLASDEVGNTLAGLS